jgi:hypothetical protein
MLSELFIILQKNAKKNKLIGLGKFFLLLLSQYFMAAEKGWNIENSCFEGTAMIFSNTSWSSIHLFGQAYMFSFAHLGDVDFSFHWKRDWQVCDAESKVFGLNETRGRCWKNNS